MSGKKVVMSGMRPTGRLHVGHQWGALKNWVALQDSHECFFSVVDWHMLTTGYEETGCLQENVREMVLRLMTGRGLALLQFGVTLPVYAVFGMLGALLGLAFFRKAPPPAAAG